jgi:hypothetical protein
MTLGKGEKWQEIKKQGRDFVNLATIPYLGHVETNCQLKRADHDVEDRTSRLVYEFAGLPDSLVTDTTVGVDPDASSYLHWLH